MDFYWREDRIIETNFIFYILHSKLIFRHEWSNTLKYSAIYPNLNPPPQKNQSHHTSSKPFQSNSSQKKNRFWQPTITNSISPKNIQRKSTPRRLIRGTFLFKLVDAGSSGLPPLLPLREETKAKEEASCLYRSNKVHPRREKFSKADPDRYVHRLLLLLLHLAVFSSFHAFPLGFIPLLFLPPPPFFPPSKTQPKFFRVATKLGNVGPGLRDPPLRD